MITVRLEGAVLRPAAGVAGSCKAGRGIYSSPGAWLGASVARGGIDVRARQRWTAKEATHIGASAVSPLPRLPRGPSPPRLFSPENKLAGPALSLPAVPPSDVARTLGPRWELFSGINGPRDTGEVGPGLVSRWGEFAGSGQGLLPCLISQVLRPCGATPWRNPRSLPPPGPQTAPPQSTPRFN